ncbi:Ig-like domain-containing protein [Citricoccus nitrophenolicus]|uniref:Ig-like domain-containing protein n=1 Tax=Citricoccus nitrophenolicus TaxID=863575 RepID=UPI00360A9320
MTIAAGHTPDLSLPRRTLLGLGRSLAAASVAVLLMTGLAGPAAADTRPEDTTPSPSPSAPPEFVDCAGILVQAGVPESIGFQITDADDDPVTLTAGESSIGAEITIEGHILTYTAPPEYTGDELLAVTADDGQGGTAFCEVYVKVGPAPTPAPTPDPTDPSPNPTDSPSTPPTQDPTTPAPSPTSSTPDPTGPTQGPTSTPAPSSEPSSAPSGSSPDDSPSASAPAGGDGSGTPPRHTGHHRPRQRPERRGHRRGQQQPVPGGRVPPCHRRPGLHRHPHRAAAGPGP